MIGWWKGRDSKTRPRIGEFVSYGIVVVSRSPEYLKNPRVWHWIWHWGYGQRRCGCRGVSTTTALHEGMTAQSNPHLARGPLDLLRRILPRHGRNCVVARMGMKGPANKCLVPTLGDPRGSPTVSARSEADLATEGGDVLDVRVLAFHPVKRCFVRQPTSLRNSRWPPTRWFGGGCLAVTRLALRGALINSVGVEIQRCIGQH